MEAIFVRSVLESPESTPEYELGAMAARGGASGKSVPFKHGSKQAMRFVYGFDTAIRDMRRSAAMKSLSPEPTGSK